MTNPFENASSIYHNGNEIESIVRASDNKVLYSKIEPSNIILSSNKDILSYIDLDSCILTATVYDENNNLLPGQSVSMKVYGAFGELIDTLTVIDTGDGIYGASYSSHGVGDVTVVAECGNLSDDYSIEDCDYYNSSEVTKTNNQSSTIYDNNMSIALPSKCEISFSILADNVSDGSERRYFLLPKSQYSSGTTQPTYALYCDIASSKITFGKRDNGSSIKPTDISSKNNISNNTYYNIKLVRDGTTVTAYVDDVSMGDYTGLSFLGNYSDWCISMMRWSVGGTSKIKNVKIKPLQFISVDVDNPVLSFADSTQANPQTATLTATVNPIQSGKSVKIYKDDTLIATEQTDSQGQVSYEYESQGVGDVEFTFECGLLTKTFIIEDIEFYNDGSAVKSIYSDNGASISSSDGWIVMTTSSSGEKHIKYPISFTNSDNIEIEYIMGDGTTQPMTHLIGNRDTTGYQGYCMYSSSSNTLWWEIGTSNSVGITLSTGDKIRVRRENGNSMLYVNDVLKFSNTHTINGNCTFGHYTNNGRVQRAKEIKIRRL